MSLNYSANFSGSNDLSVANFTGNPAAFSVSCWVNLTQSQTSRVFFSDFNGSNNWAPGISDSSTNQIKFFLGSATLTSPTVLTNGTWYHAIFTHDGTTAKIYLNGNTTPNASSVTALTYGAVATNNYIGSLNGSSQRLIGRLAGVGYWSKALSTTEVTTLYNGGAGLAGSELSGTLLTSLGSYQDFINGASLGTDSSGNGHNFTNNSTVVQGFGPVNPIGPYSGRTQRPYHPILQPSWSRGLVRAQVGFKTSGANLFPDIALPASQPFVTAGTVAWTSNQYGICLAPNDSTGQGCPNLQAAIAGGATEFTMSALALTDTTTGGGSGLRHLWGDEGTPTGFRLAIQSGSLIMQVGADGAFANLVIDLPPINILVLITARLTTAGVLSIWYGPLKIAERTDASAAYGTGSSGLGLGSSVSVPTRNWSGQVNGGYVWNYALPDSMIISLASDFFAPVRSYTGIVKIFPGVPVGFVQVPLDGLNYTADMTGGFRG